MLEFKKINKQFKCLLYKLNNNKLKIKLNITQIKIIHVNKLKIDKLNKITIN